MVVATVINDIVSRQVYEQLQFYRAIKLLVNYLSRYLLELHTSNHALLLLIDHRN